MDIMEKRVFDLLLNYPAQEENRVKERHTHNKTIRKPSITITDDDPIGWLLLEEILNDPIIKERFVQKTLFRLFELPQLADTVERRSKRNKSCPEGEPLEYYELQESGQKKKRKGSAYRLKRDLHTWKKLFLLFEKEGETEYLKFIYSPYTHSFTKELNKLMLDFFSDLFRYAKAHYQNEKNFSVPPLAEGTETWSEWLLEYGSLISIYLKDKRQFGIVSKGLWSSSLDLVAHIKMNSDKKQKDLEMAVVWGFYRNIGFSNSIIKSCLRKIKEKEAGKEAEKT